MRLPSFIAAVALIIVTGHIASAQSISFDYDKTTNFSTFKTYTWVRGTEVPDEFNHARLFKNYPPAQ